MPKNGGEIFTSDLLYEGILIREASIGDQAIAHELAKLLKRTEICQRVLIIPLKVNSVLLNKTTFCLNKYMCG